MKLTFSLQPPYSPSLEFRSHELCVCVRVSHFVVSDSLQPHGLESSRILCPWNFPGKDAGVGCHFLLQSHWLGVTNYILEALVFLFCHFTHL